MISFASRRSNSKLCAAVADRFDVKKENNAPNLISTGLSLSCGCLIARGGNIAYNSVLVTITHSIL